VKERSGHEEGMRALRLLLLPKKLPLESEVFGLVYETEKRIVFKGLGMRWTKQLLLLSFILFCLQLH